MYNFHNPAEDLQVGEEMACSNAALAEWIVPCFISYRIAKRREVIQSLFVVMIVELKIFRTRLSIRTRDSFQS